MESEIVNEKLEKKTVATVIGGAGFLGSHIVDSLLRRGYVVKVIDNLSSCWLNEETGNPRFVPDGVDVGQMWSVDVDTEVLVLSHLRWPFERSIAEYSSAVSEYVARSVTLVSNFAMKRDATTRLKVIVPSSIEIHVPPSTRRRRRPPDLTLLAAMRGLLRYLHRPARISVEMIHLPELFGPRQLPDTGYVPSKLIAGSLPIERTPPFGEIAYVVDAAEFIASRAGLDFIEVETSTRGYTVIDGLRRAPFGTFLDETSFTEAIDRTADFYRAEGFDLNTITDWKVYE